MYFPMQKSSPAPLDTTETGFSLPFCPPHGTAWDNSVETIRKEKKKEQSNKEAGRQERKEGMRRVRETEKEAVRLI